MKHAYLYVIGSTEHPHLKIGYSNNPIKRLADLQIAHANPLSLLHFTDISPETVKLAEKHIHACFADKKTSGEWFDIDLNTAVNAISSVRVEAGIKK